MRASAIRLLGALGLGASLLPGPVPAQPARRVPLAAGDVDAIARLVMLEDRRQFDAAELGRLLGSPHPELRRRAALAVGRIPDKGGVALLRSQPLDADTSVAATVVFAIGQLHDTTTIAWFDSLLSSPRLAPTVATEAAIALGKIKTAGARDVLARYLARAAEGPRTSRTIGEALLSIGRSTARGDIAPIIPFTRSSSEELRWRAAWALFRPRDPLAVPALLTMSEDPSALVRSWAVRGLVKAQADSAMLGAKAEARLLAATRDNDRRVRTEAVRALGTYADSAAVAMLLTALASPDSWVSVSAAEGLGRARSAATVAALVAATTAARPCALRITAMQALQAFSPADALAAAAGIMSDTVPYCQTTARQAHWTLRDAMLTPAGRREARAADLASTDAAIRAAAIRTMTPWADSTDLPALLELQNRERNAITPPAAVSPVAAAAAAVIAAIERRRSGSGGRGARPPAAPPTRDFADYRRIVERWVVPDYNGAPRPTARWDTPRGPIELELYPGDAPLAVDDFVKTMESGTLVGTEFTRVVPDFVDQQQTIPGGARLRDEVNRHGLTRANLAWATGGLDTGTPGYTLAHTPQPHNEGDFTALSRVIRGMEAVDRIELGDRITAVRMLTGGRSR